MMLSRATIFLFISLIMSPTVAANGSIFDVLDERFFDGAWTNVSEGEPVKTVQTSGHIRGWIDIVGFESLCNIDGVDYVEGDPANAAIVKYDAWDTIDGWNSNVDYLTKTLSLIDDGENVTAKLHVDLLWHTSRLRCSGSAETGGRHCWISKTYHRETANFYAVELCPDVLTPIENITASITIQNNSFSPYTSVSVPTQANIVSTEFIYKNNTVKHYHSLGWITNNSNGNEHVEFLNKSFWIEDDDQNVIRHQGDQCIINEAPLNLSELQITISSPYTTKNVTDYNVTMINSKPSDYIQFEMIMIFLIVIGVLVWGTINCARSVIHR